MSNRKNSISSRSVFDYITIFVMILSFGTAYFYLYNAGITLLLLLVISVLYKIINWAPIKFNLFSIVYLILIPINIFLYGCDMNMIGDIIFLISCMLIFSSFNFDSFRHKYLNVVFILAFVSIVLEFFYLFGVIRPILVDVKYGLFGHYMYGYHVFGGGQWGMHNQLSGMFWEPGIYQMVLNLSLIINLDLFDKHVLVKYKKIKIATIFFAIIMTMSTTGYLVLGVVILGWLFKKSKISLGYMILISTAILLFLAVIKYSTVIAGKFSEDNASYVIRSNDVFSFFEIIREYPLFGAGVHSRTYMNIAAKYGMTGAQSAGILFQTAQFGLFWVAAFFFSCLIEFRKRRIMMKSLFYVTAVLFLGMGEPLAYAPLMLIYVLPFKKIIKHGKVVNNCNTNLQYGSAAS